MAATRVLMLLENYPYPHDIRVRYEAEALTGAGYDVTVIAPRRGDEPWVDSVAGVAVYRFPPPPEGSGVVGYVAEYGFALVALFVLSLRVWLRRGVDVVHLHNPPDLLVLIGGLFKLAGRRVVYDHHDLAPEMYEVLFDGGSPLLRRLLLALERLSCRVADHVIATNDSYRALDITRHGVDPARVTVVRNGPDPSLLHPGPAETTDTSRERVTLCYVGDMGRHDGLDYLLRALHHLRQERGRADFQAVLVGQGSAWEESRALATELGLDEHVTFTGRVPHREVPGYLERADICLAPEPSNPYNDRSTMIKIMEYMAMARPIVAFDLPEHRVSAGTAALYARANDVSDFAARIEALMDDPARRRAMGAAGRQRVEGELAWPYQAEKLLGAYATLTRPRPARTGARS